MICWAENLGECSGKITGEHIFTEKLFKGKVEYKTERILNNEITPNWLKQSSFNISIHKCQSNILCEKHNKILGKYADRAALNLSRALLYLHDPMRLPGSKICRPPIQKKIMGDFFGQWLCKTHCNILAAQGIKPGDDYINFSFGKNTKRRIFFYFPFRVGLTMKIEEGHITYINYFNKSDIIFIIILSGLRILVSTIPIQNIIIADCKINKDDWMDRIACIQKNTPLGLYKINIEWKDR